MEHRGRDTLYFEKISLSSNLNDSQTPSEDEKLNNENENRKNAPKKKVGLKVWKHFCIYNFTNNRSAHFFFTFIIQKGVFDTIEYSNEDKIFIVRKHDKSNTITKINATQEESDKLGIIVPLKSFLNGIINSPI